MAMGGVGEAALLGAVMGGGSAMLTGGDPLKGALMGTLTGGAGAGISSLLPGATAVAPGVITPAIAPTVAEAAIAPTLVESAITPNLANAVTPAVASSAPVSTSIPLGSPAASALPNVPNSASVISPFKAQPTGGISNLLSNPTTQSLASVTGSGSTALTGGVTPPPITTPAPPKTFAEGMKKFMDNPLESMKGSPFTSAGSALTGATAARKKKEEEEEYSGPLSRFKYNPDKYRPSGYADGGITSLGGYDQMVGEEPMYMSNMAAGGIADLGSYSDGGRMLKGPGDGMSDSIPANIAGKRPARLADGEFVIPADVVSHLGNGSTDAGAKQLYAMMAKVRKARTGRKAQGREINPRQYMAA